MYFPLFFKYFWCTHDDKRKRIFVALKNSENISCDGNKASARTDKRFIEYVWYWQYMYVSKTIPINNQFFLWFSGAQLAAHFKPVPTMLHITQMDLQNRTSSFIDHYWYYIIMYLIVMVW